MTVTPMFQRRSASRVPAAPSPRASPPGEDVPEVVSGELISSEWGSAVSEDLAELHETKADTSVSIGTAAPLSGGGDLTASRTLSVDLFDADSSGVVPPSGGSTDVFLRGDGVWAAPPGGGGGGIAGVTVQESDSTVTSTATTLDFGAGFDVTESPANEANVALDLGEYAGAALAVAGGGTGRTSHAAYGLLAGGTTASGPQQSIAPVAAASVLKAQGAAALPAWGTIVTGEIADDAVTYAKVQDVTATDRILGRSSVGAGIIQEIVCTAAARSLLDDVSVAAQRATLAVAEAQNGLIAQWKGTQAQYDAIGTKDPNTLYFII